jgi:type IV/VI secretion system ImpK/VasF family protein
LFEYFAPVFSAGLDVRRRLASTAPEVPSCAEIHERLRSVIGSAESAARRDAKGDHDIEHGKRAAVAWLDELMTVHPQRRGATGAKPLQVDLFRTFNLGDEFFDDLTRIQDRDDVREIYYMAMLLGFRGKHGFDRDPQQLNAVLDSASRHLPVPPATMSTLADEKILKQPYRTDDPGPPRVPGTWDIWLVRILIALAILLPLVLWFLQNDPFRRPLRIAPSKVEERLKDAVCAGGRVEIDDRNNVVLHGFVADPQDIFRIRDTVKRIEGVAEVFSNLKVVERAEFCRVLETIAPFTSPAAAAAPDASHNRAIEERSIEDEDRRVLLVDVKAVGSPTYAYVDYYTLDGYVVHMLPNPLMPTNRMAISEAIRIGEPGPGKRHYLVQEPFGEELLIVIATTVPLFAQPRQEIERADAYLVALQAALDGAVRDGRKDSIRSRYDFIRTSPHPPLPTGR